MPQRRTLRRFAIGLEGRGNAKQTGKPLGDGVVKTGEVKSVALSMVPINSREL